MDKKKWYTKFMVIKPDQYNMKYIIIALLVFLSSCASLEDHTYEAERYCNHVFNTKNLNVNNSENNKWNRRQFTQCVANKANASANTSQANATWASVITAWITMGVGLLVGLSK